MTGDHVLELEGMSAGYTLAPVVRDLTLTVAAGEVVALLGPNGAGKTTTLRAVSRLVPPSAGTVRLLGQSLNRMAPHRVARLGLVHMSDARGIFPSLTVDEHFRLGSGKQKVDRGLAFDYFPELASLGSRRAGLLSGGEQQMLGLGRALARHPKVLMVDEMSLGLAPVIVKRLLPTVRRFAKETGAGVLVVEQQIQMALEIADRGYVLVHGDLVMTDTATNLLADRRLIASTYLGSH